jgi:hypothetical protein
MSLFYYQSYFLLNHIGLLGLAEAPNSSYQQFIQLPQVQGKEKLVCTTNFASHTHELTTNFGCKLYTLHHMLRKSTKQL